MKSSRRGTVAAYLRVSTGGQDARTQRSAITRAAKARGDQVARWFEETRSGRSMVRPALQELRRAARGGELRRVYVFRIDRLTRRGAADLFAIVDDLHRSGCELVSIGDMGVDVAGPFADVVLAVLAALAKGELEANRERLAAARARVERAGGRWGRPRRLCKLDLAKLRKLRDEGASVRELAQRLGLPRSTVHDALRR